jgi:hypothetical protein
VNAAKIGSTALGLFIVGFALIFIGVGCYLAYLQSHALQTYLPVPATILSREIKSSHDSHGSTTYAPSASYRYTINGQSYECSQVSVTKVSSSYRWASEQLAKLPGGPNVTAYYNPAKPGRAFLLRDASFFPYIFVLFPMLFVCVGLSVLTTSQTTPFSDLRGLLPVTVLWNLVGVIAAFHFYRVAGGFDLTAKIALSIYGLIGGLALYAAVYLKIEARTLAAAGSVADSR